MDKSTCNFDDVKVDTDATCRKIKWVEAKCLSNPKSQTSPPG
jgi:hypothetical protein